MTVGTSIDISGSPVMAGLVCCLVRRLDANRQDNLLIFRMFKRSRADADQYPTACTCELRGARQRFRRPGGRQRKNEYSANASARKHDCVLSCFRCNLECGCNSYRMSVGVAAFTEHKTV